MKALLLVVAIFAVTNATYDHQSLVLIKRLYGPQHVRGLSIYFGNLLGPEWERDVHNTMYRIYHPERPKEVTWNIRHPRSHPEVYIRQRFVPNLHHNGYNTQ